jgi:DNA-binding MarR family transcriptional regulator
VVARLERRGFVERSACPEDRRATNASLTKTGWKKVVDTAPGHVGAVRQHVFDALTPAQVEQLQEIGEAILERIDPEGTNALYRRSHSG